MLFPCVMFFTFCSLLFSPLINLPHSESLGSWNLFLPGILKTRKHDASQKGSIYVLG
jgi:hypothetical protein